MKIKWSTQCRRGLPNSSVVSSIMLFAALLASPAGASNNPVPLVSNISPVSALPGGAQFTLTVNGANFVSNSTVQWNGTGLTTAYVSSTQLTATVSATNIASGGTGWITVANPAPGGGTSNVIYLPVASPVSTLTVATKQATVGSFPYEIGEGDFNGDGILDLAVSNFGGATASILLGNGDGTFQTQRTFSTISDPFGFSAGDLNGDGKLDLVVGNDYRGLNVALGNGDGTFTLSTLSGGSCPLDPVLADANGDGHLDIVVGNECGTGVLVYLGNGDGTFQTPTTVGSVSDPFQVAVGDFNGDGKLDIVAPSWNSNNLLLYSGNGNGTFGTGTSIASLSFPWSIAAADINGDGNLDLVVSSANDSGIIVLLGNGNGTFQSARTVVASGDYNKVAVGDLNSDGHLDIVGNSGDDGSINVWFGNGDGTFQSPQTLGNTGGTYGLAIGNFASGGSLGVASPNVNNTVTLFLQNVSLSPASQAFGTVNVGSSSSAQTFTLTNSTANTVHVTGITFTGTNAGDFSEMDTCSSPISSGGTCTISVTFSPAGSGSRGATLNVADDAPSSPQSASLTGTGTAAPIVGLSPTGLSFGNQNDGTTSTAQQITLSNNGNATLTGLTISIIGTNHADFSQSNNCASTLTATSSCTINVQFTPSLAGSESASVQLADNASNSPQSVSLSGTGVALAPAVGLSPTSLSFGNQSLGTTSSAQSVTVTNTGNASLTSITVSIIGANAADFSETNNCAGNTITANGTCMVSVRFSPSATAAEVAQVRISDNASSSPQAIPLTGTGVQTPTSLNYIQAAPSPIVAGSSIGTIQVGVYDFRPALVTGSAASVQITITGPNSFSSSQTQTAVSGIATFNFSSVALNTVGQYTVTATSSGLTPASSNTNVTALISSEQIVVSGFPSPTYAQVPHNVTVSIEDSFNNVITSYTGTMMLSIPGSAGTVTPSSYTFTSTDQGTHTFSVTMNTVGTQSIAATDGTLSGSETGIQVNARPQFIINTLTDDAGSAACDGNEPCSLRSAIAQANMLGAGDITVDTTQLTGSAPWTTTLSNGALEISSNVSLAGPVSGQFSISGNNASRVFEVDSGGYAQVSNLTVTNGAASDNGGGISNAGTLNIFQVTVTGNTAPQNGGGIYNTSTLSLVDSTVSANTAQGNGGGIANTVNINVQNSTLSGNTATGNGGAVENLGTLGVFQSTISGNRAVDGAGFENESSGTAQVFQSTVSANTSTSQAGVTVSNQNTAGNTIMITNSIVAGNSAPGGDCTNCGQQNTSNLFDATAAALNLSPLANNGGPTETMVPLTGSPAIGAGTVALALDDNNQPLTLDQRQAGYTRILNNSVDLGAVQSNSGQPATLAFVLPTSVVAGVAQTVTVNALTPSGNPAATYANTVHFSSSDADAQLPADYTFLSTDSGSHSFSVTFHSAGSQTLTAADTVVPYLHASQTVTVSFGASFTLGVVSGSGQSAIVGSAFATALSVRVTDAYSNVASGATVVFMAPASGASGTFTNSGNSVSVLTDANGIATAPALSANNTIGQYVVTASVQGVPTSGTFTLTNLVKPDFSITANPTTLTVQIGQSGSSTFTVTPVGGYSGTIQFSCTGLPTGASCDFQPAQLVLNGGNTAASAQLTLHTTGTNGVVSSHQPFIPSTRRNAPRPRTAFGLLVLLTMLTMARVIPIPRRYGLGIAMLALVSALSVGLDGCGSTAPAPAASSPSATPAGQYPVTVTAAVTGGSGAQHSALLTINITQ